MLLRPQPAALQPRPGSRTPCAVYPAFGCVHAGPVPPSIGPGPCLPLRLAHHAERVHQLWALLQHHLEGGRNLTHGSQELWLRMVAAGTHERKHVIRSGRRGRVDGGGSDRGSWADRWPSVLPLWASLPRLHAARRAVLERQRLPGHGLAAQLPPAPSAGPRERCPPTTFRWCRCPCPAFWRRLRRGCRLRSSAAWGIKEPCLRQSWQCQRQGTGEKRLACHKDSEPPT